MWPNHLAHEDVNVRCACSLSYLTRVFPLRFAKQYPLFIILLIIAGLITKGTTHWSQSLRRGGRGYDVYDSVNERQTHTLMVYSPFNIFGSEDQCPFVARQCHDRVLWRELRMTTNSQNTLLPDGPSPSGESASQTVPPGGYEYSDSGISAASRPSRFQ